MNPFATPGLKRKDRDVNSSSQKKKKKSHVYVKDSTSLIESLELWDCGELEFTEPIILGNL